MAAHTVGRGSVKQPTPTDDTASGPYARCHKDVVAETLSSPQLALCLVAWCHAMPTMSWVRT